MAYEPTVWECGDTITAEKLNKLEQAVASGGSIEPLVVNVVSTALDKTWQEIHDAFPNVVIDDGDSLYAIATVGIGPYGDYIVVTYMAGGYETNTPDGYPAVGEDD